MLVMLLLLGTVPAWAQASFTSDLVYINGTRQQSPGSTSNTTFSGIYYTNNAGTSGATVPFNGADLGSYDRNTSKTNSLSINAEANTQTADGNIVQNTQLLYRVLRADGTSAESNAIPLNLPFTTGNPGAAAQWRNLTNQLDLLSLDATARPGDYYLEVSFQGRALIANTTDTLTFADDNGTQLYKAKFSVTVNGNKFVTSSWNSTVDPDWFNPFNWTNGVPDANTDVTIQYKQGLKTPDIASTSNGDARIALARNLTLIGDGSPGLPILETEDNTNLVIYGNLQDVNNGLTQNGGVFTLGGQNQTFDSSITLNYLTISGGGTKTLVRPISVANAITFTGSGSGVLAANNSDPLQGITLQASASLIGETEGAYVLGLIKTTRNVGQGGTGETFGNIGLDLKANSHAPGYVTIVRTSNIYYGAGNSVSIQRGFFLTANVSSLTNFDLTFHYLNDNLNGISPANLRLFRSQTGRAPFEALNFTSTDNNTLTRTGVSGRLAATFTLGDINNPLPVELVSFTATGTAQGAALKWLTASEVNNKGFGVERQVAGATTWQPVGYVAATNLANGSSYSFLDKTLPASATQVYYRLRQEDIDGSLHYSAVATISRAALGADLTLSPVPLQGGPLAVSFAEAGQAGTELVVLNMQGQRVARYTTAASTDAAVSLPLDNLAAGVYVLSVQVPGQTTRHARFVKQ